MKLNILHFSDLHYEEKYNTELTLLRDKMIESIDKFKENNQIDVVVFSGDLVQIPSITSFKDAYDNFILPLLSEQKDKLCLTIGNHDVVTKNRNKLNFSGLKDYVIKQQDKTIIHDLVEDKIEMNEFTDFNNFVKELNLNNLKESYTNYSIYEYAISTNLTLGIVSINSSIFMEGSKDDYGNLYFVSDILLEASKKISLCSIKAVNVHHSFGWFQNPKELEKILLEKFNLVFFGHEHEYDGKYVLDFNNRDIVNFHAPSIFHNKNPKNGFSIYSFDIDCDSISINNFIYNDRDKLFENIEQKNIENINITSKVSKAIRNLSICSQMYPIVKEKINKYLTINLTSEVNKKDIEDIYVYQKIIEKKSTNEEDIAEYTLENIIQEKKDILIIGKEEGGKSTTLNMITLLCLKTYTELIPIYIPSSELINQKSLRVFNAFVAEYLDKNYGKNKFNIQKMQLEKRFIFLIDDISFLSTELFDEIKSLNNKIIATTVEQKNVEDVIQQDLTQIGTKKEDKFLSFLKLDLKNFRKKDRKKLALNIAPSDMSSKISNSINKTIVDFNLPPTPFITTLLIWMHTQNIDIRNNKPEIVDVFLDYLLEKTELSKQFKGKFNFADKKELLANIAYEYFTMESFAIKEDVILQCIINYVTKYGFDISSTEILQYFLDRKIFMKNNNTIMFSYKVFYYYFMSLYMINNHDFTKNVMKNKKLLLNMIEELKFYSAIKTDDNIFVEHLIDIINNSQYKKKFNNTFEHIKLTRKDITKKISKVDVLLDTNEKTQNTTEVNEDSYKKLYDIIDDKTTDEHEKRVIEYNMEQNNPIKYHQRYYKEEFLVLNTILSEFVKNLTTITKEDKCKYLDFTINNYALYFKFWEFLYKNNALLKKFISIKYNVSKEKLEDKEFSKIIELIKMHTLNIITELTEESLATPKLAKIYLDNISHEDDLYKFFLYTIIEISINENNIEELLEQLIYNSNNQNIFQILYTIISYNYYDKDYTSKTKKILKNTLIKLHLIKVHGKKAITDKRIYNTYFSISRKDVDEHLKMLKLLI